MSRGIGRLLQVSLLTLAGAAVCGAQTVEMPSVEYPKLPCELRSEHKVFVQAPLSTRQELVRELSRDSHLVIAERPEEADYFILFAYTAVVADGSASFAGEATAMSGHAEMTAVKFVHYREGQVRPRILFYWQGERKTRNVPLPFGGAPANGFAAPRSTRSAVEELVGKLALWALTKKWSNTFSFDPFTNQLTISTGGKFEKNGAKAFLKQLKEARGDSYALSCAAASLPADVHPAKPSYWLDAPPAVPPRMVPFESQRIQPPAQSRPPGGGTRPRSFKRTKKGREDR
jgi:hypothetical protein